jgi:hypothetical protein
MGWLRYAGQTVVAENLSQTKRLLLLARHTRKILTRDIACNGVHHGGLVTIEKH